MTPTVAPLSMTMTTISGLVLKEYFLWDVVQLPPVSPRTTTLDLRAHTTVQLVRLTPTVVTVLKSIDLCLETGLNIEGINAEVAAGR